jgi:hypothetical protein
MLRQKWQWHLLTMRRQMVQTHEIKPRIEACSTR